VEDVLGRGGALNNKRRNAISGLRRSSVRHAASGKLEASRTVLQASSIQKEAWRTEVFLELGSSARRGVL
jgi:hypothetical protein